MKLKGEKTVFGKDIKTPEHFIEDLCDRLNGVFNQVLEFEDETLQVGMLMGFLRGLIDRVNRVCER
jgi:hypothetical protein